MSRAAAILRLRHTRSPLARSAGEGLGVRAALTFPPAPCRSSTGRGRGGDEQSSSDPAPASHQITPLPQRGRGAGGEGDQALRAGLNIPLGCGLGLLRQCFSSPLYLAVRLYLMQAARRKAVQ